MFFSRVSSWCMQRVASLSLVALLLLLYLALWHDRPSHHPHHGKGSSSKPTSGRRDTLTSAQLVFAFYTILAHVMAAAFTIRLCFGIGRLMRGLKRARRQTHSNSYSTLSPISKLNASEYDDSVSSISSIADEADDQHVLHSIIIPNYKEELDTLRETLEVLACHSAANSTYDIYLAMELGESGAEAKAALLLKEFADQFRSVDYTLHPQGIPGEAQGKSSSLCWAAKYVSGRYEDLKMKKRVIITVIDADSHLSTNYFTSITRMHLANSEKAETTIYVPPIIFDRNAHTVPVLVRVADLFWAGAGLSGHSCMDPICPPTSVYSLPLCLVEFAGGWDAGADAIGEDLHMYIKCFFALNGNLNARTVLSAASQSNVHSGGKGVGNYLQNCNARYRQALRHMWGALDSGYVLRSASEMWWRSKNGNGLPRPHWLNTSILFHRLYEAHLLPAHIAFLILCASAYTVLVPTRLTPIRLQQAFDITAYLRILSMINLIIFLMIYERFHYICVKSREEEMVCAGLAVRMVEGFSYRKLRKNWLDYGVFPFTGIAFGTVPLVYALVCQFWTTRLVYRVSAKPKRAVLP